MSIDPNGQTDSQDPVSELVQDLSSVDDNSPDATDNATSIEDSNGDRIELGEDGSNSIKK